jgi:hypothetical protein
MENRIERIGELSDGRVLVALSTQGIAGLMEAADRIVALCSAIRRLEETLSLGFRASEGPLGMAKQFGVRELGRDDAGAQRHDLRVVALAGALGGVRVMRLGRAHAGHLVGGDGHTDAGAAEGDATLRLAGGDVGGEPVAEVRIVDAGIAVRTQIIHLVPLPAQPIGERGLHRSGGVV